MYQFKSPEDTIAAISTATGPGGIGIVRLSGKESLLIADQMFMTRKNKRPSDFKSFTVHYGMIVDRSKDKDDGKENDYETVDEALVTVMRAPKSYTKEDMVEISCHGGAAPLRMILSLTIGLGARLAEPGEFTKRAFLNGRIDLTQAEAVLDIIYSKTNTFLKISTNQLKGDLSTALEDIRQRLMEIYIRLEAIVNFPEDDIDAQMKEDFLQDIQKAQQRVQKLLATSEQGRILREGIKIVLCGKPNVGKSSLLNVLLRQHRAIVSPIAGTTRDAIEETTQIKGIPFQVVDTAGILEPRDLIEEEAVKRSHMYIQSADLILLILDGNQKISREDQDLIREIFDSVGNYKNVLTARKFLYSKSNSDRREEFSCKEAFQNHSERQNIIIVLNKCDLENKIEIPKIREYFADQKIIKISALHKNGITDLEDAIIELVFQGKGLDTDGILVTNIRHIQSLKSCLTALIRGSESLAQGLPPEFISEDIKIAINDLDAVTGRNIDADLLEKIFSQFCIGK